jgi:hypothetical protein
VKCFKCRYSEMESWCLFRGKCLLGVVSVLQNLLYAWDRVVNDVCTASRPRKVPTRCHSSLSSLSARILSRFVPSVSSQRSSSMNVSMH